MIYFHLKSCVNQIFVAMTMQTRVRGKSRGRPRGFDREAALARALEAFWRRGYEATSISELTSLMGITPPSLYAAFGSKEQLFFEAVERYQETHGEETARALREEPTARRAIARLLRDTAAVFCRPGFPRGCLVISAATNCSEESEQVEARMREMRAKSEAAIHARIAQGVTEGDLPADADPAALTKFYVTIIQGMSIQARDGASRSELETVAEQALRAWPA